jgi:7,8-dihydropterin-6-yl-methyl-4-(beta-D-ribofuranosyl)aminobenzene 5'-phosphate synthase
MKITVLADNFVNERGILAEHGLSLFIEHNGLKILFDAGQTDVYVKNARARGIDLSKTDFVVLSHGHYDHCGGMTFLSAVVPVYVRKQAFEAKYVIKGDGSRYIGIDENSGKKIMQPAVFTSVVTEIRRGIFTISGIPFTDKSESLAQNFYIKDGGNFGKDNFDDEQILVTDTEKGLCVFSGCCHRGVINTIEYVKKTFGKNVYAFFAGMHLNGAAKEKIDHVITYLEKSGTERLFPLHCTGIDAINEIKKRIGGCLVLYSGDSVEI